MTGKIALYARVSTQEQAKEGYSIEEQVERLKKYAESQGWKNVEVFVDPGFSGASLDRPAMKRLISDVEAGKVKKVVVYKLDRLSRSQKDTLELIEDVFRKNGCDFESMSEKFDTGTPFGNAMIGILAVFAQLERETIKERLSMGREGRAKNGLWRGGNGIPVGYDYLDGQLIVNDVEAMQVREIFNLYNQGYGFEKIVRILEEKGFSHKYGSWNHMRVKSIITNPLYIGKVTYNGSIYEGQHDGIVPEDVFNQAQELYHHKSDVKSYKTDTTSILGGMIYCKKCGARYFRWKSHGRIYKYSCYSRRNVSAYMKKADKCDNKHWKADEMDRLVLGQICELALDPKRIREVSSRPDLEDKTDALTEMLKKVESQRLRLLDLYSLGSFSIDELSDKMESLNEQKKKLEKEIESESTKARGLSLADAEVQIKSMRDLVEKGDRDKIRNAARLLIDYIEIDDEDLYIHWNF